MPLESRRFQPVSGRLDHRPQPDYRGELVRVDIATPLASLEFCVACPSVPTLIAAVEKGTPTSLWVDDPGREMHGAKRLSSTRVPVVRAHGVTWRLPASALRSMSHDVFSKVTFVFVDGDLDGDVRGLAWPASLRHLYFFRVEAPPDRVSWPPTLHYDSRQQAYFRNRLARVAQTA